MVRRKDSCVSTNTNFSPTRRISSTKNMAGRSLIIFMISLYCLCLSADDRVVPLSADEDTFQPLCSRMCNSSKGSNYSLIPPYQCSCSKSCAVFGDCCYDSPYKVTSSPLQIQFVCLHVEGKGKFKAVLSCPPHIRSDSCREQLGHMPPVTSRVTNVTYGNALCATCNEDGEDLVKWNVQLRGSSYEDSLDLTRKVNDGLSLLPGEKLERNWTYHKFHIYDDDFRILNDLELRPCDLPNMVNMCSTTWREPDSDQKCRSYKDPVYFGNTLFRNSHCAECHYKNLSDADCSPRFMKEILEQGRVDKRDIFSCMTTPPYSCNPKRKGGKKSLLRRIFNPDYTKPKQNENICSWQEGESCPDGERFDDLTCGCRKIRRG